MTTDDKLAVSQEDRDRAARFTRARSLKAMRPTARRTIMEELDALAERVEAAARECDVDAELLGRVFALLDNFPANGRPDDHDAATAAVILGFIANHEQKERCPACGTERTGYSYVKPTQAGRLFAAALRANREKVG